MSWVSCIEWIDIAMLLFSKLNVILFVLLTLFKSPFVGDFRSNCANKNTPSRGKVLSHKAFSWPWVSTDTVTCQLAATLSGAKLGRYGELTQSQKRSGLQTRQRSPNVTSHVTWPPPTLQVRNCRLQLRVNRPVLISSFVKIFPYKQKVKN